jgi:hypothetical protein
LFFSAAGNPAADFRVRPKSTLDFLESESDARNVPSREEDWGDFKPY